jgi:hypothetical protein
MLSTNARSVPERHTPWKHPLFDLLREGVCHDAVPSGTRIDIAWRVTRLPLRPRAGMVFTIEPMINLRGPEPEALVRGDGTSLPRRRLGREVEELHAQSRRPYSSVTSVRAAPPQGAALAGGWMTNQLEPSVFAGVSLGTMVAPASATSIASSTSFMRAGTRHQLARALPSGAGVHADRSLHPRVPSGAS